MVDLLTDNGEVCGAMAWSEPDRRLVPVYARAVLLASGGLGCVYRETTNPDVATGDGVALAFRAGADIADMEMIQFHPTALFLEGAPRFLLSEALRGEGAYLRNSEGERFMGRYDEREELAPRDIVSRAIVAELHRTKSGPVYLDLTHLDPDFVPRRFPRIHETCRHYGVDLTRQPVPVHPAAHYAMGGVATDGAGATRASIEAATMRCKRRRATGEPTISGRGRLADPALPHRVCRLKPDTEGRKSLHG